MTRPGEDGDDDGRQRYLVGVVKRDPGQRDLFAELFPDQAALDAAGWCDAFGAVDDEHSPVGMHAVWAADLTPEQVGRLGEASNLRWVELQPPDLQRPTPPSSAPTGDTPLLTPLFAPPEAAA